MTKEQLVTICQNLALPGTLIIHREITPSAYYVAVYDGYEVHQFVLEQGLDNQWKSSPFQVSQQTN